jgi:hypothetical protein
MEESTIKEDDKIYPTKETATAAGTATVDSKQQTATAADTKKQTSQSHHIMKSLKRFCTNFFVEFARIIFFWLPTDELKGHALLVLHGCLGFIMFISFFLFPPRHIVRFLILVIGFCVIFSQVLFNGCVITKAEHILTGKKNTLFDYAIELFDIEPSNKVRMFTTFATFVPSMGVLFAAFLSDFWWTRTAYLIV